MCGLKRKRISCCNWVTGSGMIQKQQQISTGRYYCPILLAPSAPLPVHPSSLEQLAHSALIDVPHHSSRQGDLSQSTAL